MLRKEVSLLCVFLQIKEKKTINLDRVRTLENVQVGTWQVTGKVNGEDEPRFNTTVDIIEGRMANLDFTDEFRENEVSILVRDLPNGTIVTAKSGSRSVEEEVENGVAKFENLPHGSWELTATVNGRTVSKEVEVGSEVAQIRMLQENAQTNTQTNTLQTREPEEKTSTTTYLLGAVVVAGLGYFIWDKYGREWWKKYQEKSTESNKKS